MRWIGRFACVVVCVFLCVCLCPPAAVRAADDGPATRPEPFELKDGDRVVFLGNTFTERAQLHGYVETALTVRYPDRHVVFRNLGWSGDNVFGEARARFGNVQEGFDHLVTHVTELKPTVIFVAYGHNAAFKGEQGLPEFLGGLKKLLDTLEEKTDARIALVTPFPHEKLGPPLPDPSEYNQYLTQYVDALRDVAKKRQYHLFDLSELRSVEQCLVERGSTAIAPPDAQQTHTFNITGNQLHLTRLGYWHAANTMFWNLQVRPPRWTVSVAHDRNPLKVEGTTVSDVEWTGDSLRFTALDQMLPMPTVPVEMPDGKQVLASGDVLWQRPRVLRVQKILKPGEYAVRIDGKEYARADASVLAQGLALPRGPEFEQAEQLRQVINRKNELFFHRWRPANETYLYLFRKHEQGQNAKEMPQFDPLIEKEEKKIAELRKPVKRKYEVVRVEGEE